MNLYQSQQVYQLDKLCMDIDGQSSEQLMFKAATAVWNAVQSRWPQTQHIMVLAGSGNNGGDAFALATMALESGVRVDCFVRGDLSHQSEAARYYHDEFISMGGVVNALHIDDVENTEAEVIIDGLLGIGLNQSLDDHWQALIHTINQHTAQRVSIDIPSGLNADTGCAMPCAVNAQITVTFIGRKVGCFLADGPDYCGELFFDSLGVSEFVTQQVAKAGMALSTENVDIPLKRKNNSYKNQFGHVLVVGGDRHLSGAVRLAGRAALSTGSGLVSLCVHPDNYQIAAADAELMVSDWSMLEQMLERATVVVVGPGLGQSDSAKNLMRQLSAIDLPMVVDADALQPEFLHLLKSLNVVLTPHPGEAARLLAKTTSEIQRDRIGAMTQLLENWPFDIVLKGAGTIVGGHQTSDFSLCHNGHPGMATAGMGDVLAGMIGSYMGQGLDGLQASRAAVLIHALAAEDFARDFDENSLTAGDVIDRIAVVVKQLRMNIFKNA